MTTEPQPSVGRQLGAIPADSFANRLMLTRAHAGHLSIREAADLCDLGRGAWTNWEKGTLPGDIIDVATTVASRLGVDRDWLLFGGQLSQAENRPARRRGTAPRSTHGCATVPAGRGRDTVRAMDNRPPGRPSAATAPGIIRTAYLQRPGRP